MTDIYQIPIETQDGTQITLNSYQNKVLLIVNTATGCGLTPQYEGLQQLYDKYQAHGLEILDFPCNQFMNQAPGTDTEINQFCQLNYQTSFPRFKKIAVNGKEASPLFVYLKEQQSDPLLGKAIKWNFTKFLVDRDGQVVNRFSPQTEPEKIEESIKELLGL
ncbi:glutathione peroxidase [Streptococcus moroccensis]|uniref:Glutathione peroxidase n=1 Tax=Streptococcus moroccensis TaxID=1451356 RepID=A0ABT9YT56_9STRE|nr:glutathione peroxidase [Streptococcus moroccensis]MDQ0222543.1 glutathione peroxidase [Streptococcus moroccensis]